MPEMDGEEVLAHMQAQADLKKVPVIVISSEKDRGNACLKLGAIAYLPKPIRADELSALVARVIEATKVEERKGFMPVLFMSIGPLEMGIPLEFVRTVLLQPATIALPASPAYLSEIFELHGQPVCVLDLTQRLGVTHNEDVHERKVVVVARGKSLLGICVDEVRDPEEVPLNDVTPKKALRESDLGPLADALVGQVRTNRGVVPLVDPGQLLSKNVLRKLPAIGKQYEQVGAPTPRSTSRF
jgi:chemotaxis signal transduction protein